MAAASPFSDRMIEIASFVGSGKSYEEVAAVLVLSPHTVQNHINRARSACDAKNVTHLIVKMIGMRVLEVDELGRCVPTQPAHDKPFSGTVVS